VDKDGRCAEPITATLCAGAVVGTAFFLSETVAYLSSDPDGNGQSVASEIGTATAQFVDDVKTAAVDYYARQAVALLSAGVMEGEVSPNTALVHDVPERGSYDHPADTDLNRPRIDTTPIVESLPGRMETPYHDKSPEEYILSTPSRAGDIDSGLMLATGKPGSVAPGELGVPKSERVRHFTNSKGAQGIQDSNTIKASDQNSVFTVKAKGKPGSARDVEQQLGIGRGRGNNMVEFDASPNEFSVVKNPVTGATERVFKGDVDLTNRNPTFKKNR
jgi:hypothetical protein